MADITFYEKTGCINNTKQKQILELAGHNVTAINMIQYPWKKEELEVFFEGLEASECFNKNAPSITSGELNPNDFDKKEAINAMLNDRLLIKRPLLVIGNRRIAGFNKEELDRIVGIKTTEKEELSVLLNQDLSTCPQKAKNTSCD